MVLEWGWYQSDYGSREWSWQLRHSCECSRKKYWVCLQSLFSILVSSQTNWLDPVFMDLWILLLMPLSVETVLPEWTCYWVCLMLSSTIGAFESMWTQFAFFGFEVWRVNFVVGFATPTKFTMVLQLVRSIILYAFWALNPARESQMTPFPTVFTLRDTRVCISHSNCHNKPSDIETSIYKAFSLSTALSIPYINLYNCYIWFERHFNHLWFGYESNIVEYLVLLNDSFYVIWWEVLL